MNYPTLTKELNDKFLSLACQLSPENLYCDGECSRAEAQRKATKLHREWRILETKAGMEVSEDTVWGNYNYYRRNQ